MFKKITLNPIAYAILFLGTFIILAYSLTIYCNHHFSPLDGAAQYDTIDELFKDVQKRQRSREYQKVIDLLKRARIERLVSAELDKPMPKVVVIDGIVRAAHGIEDYKDLEKKYELVSFPETTDVVTEPGYDFWILWAERFTRRYNSSLEAGLKKKKLP